MKFLSVFLFGFWINPFLWMSGAQPDGKIILQNPSFEDKPRASACPWGWESTTPGSTPDIMPGAWDIIVPPQEGKSCVALVTREDGSREDIAQRLPQTLKAGTCYTFSIYLCHAPQYVGYNHPVRLRIWGGAGRGKEQLLASSVLIDHASWKLYKFQFVPTREMRYLTLEAFFAPGAMFHYRGNIALDNCSPIERCDKA